MVLLSKSHNFMKHVWAKKAYLRSESLYLDFQMCGGENVQKLQVFVVPADGDISVYIITEKRH